jgi:predicted nucleotidyltransferase component of viral defense system
MAEQVPILDVNEIAAGKLCALLSRQMARDFFDAYELLARNILDRERLRLAFVVYSAMNRKAWRNVSEKDVGSFQKWTVNQSWHDAMNQW